ncbi:carbohydrate kinase family protein [Pseudolysinimonas yzui]|uniref:Ribokinase n=1 Tax=Pseudolysinimonas yzui TaxID=2708254 RepID=A0A8J3GQ80_9MICO|nr:carbohydrate kinase [Pseudolysinimonas yzui]GHF13906.1 ribokinase [Pseudolysinimonas yzui]
MNIPNPRVLVVGEALVDIVRRDGDDAVHPGGSPLNVAVGLQRLEVPTTLHSSFGADPYGVAIAQHLESSGVAITPGTIGDHPTSVALATIDPAGAASYTFSIEWDPAPLQVAAGSVDALHVGSIGAVLEPGATTVERLLAELRASATISYDPNIRPQLMGSADDARPRVERIIALADVVKASDEDIAWLYPDAMVTDVMAKWRALGAGLVVVTRGSDGADAFTAEGPVHVAAPRTEVVDTIGAGDSFMSGLLAALSDLGVLGGDRREALRELSASAVAQVVEFAARCAAITVSRPGADPPMRTDLAG